MAKLEKFVVSLLTVIVVILTGLLIWLFQIKWRQPLGPSLQNSLATPFGLPPTWTPNPQSNRPPPSTPKIGSIPYASPSPENVSKTTGKCEGTSPMYILVIGSDARGDNYLYGLADVIRLVRVDFVNSRVTVLEFPRDLWVEIPDIADNLHGQDHEKLNQAYLYGNRGFGYTNDPAKGPGLLVRTLTLNFGTQIDHYVAINMRTFEKIIDAVGGIDVTLPETVDGRIASDMDNRLLFQQGTHHLDGAQALTLARIRINGTFSRADNQDRVLCALRNKLTSPEVIPNIPRLIRSFQGAMQTSLSPEQLGQLACLGTQIEPRNIILTSFPQSLFEQDRTYDPVFKKNVFTWDVDYDILREYVQRFNSGNWPDAVITHEQKQEGEALFCQ
ncbi:MAG TPA: LCP family protein [Anaerolineales bacterium]|nr:LCP family protein [Anaerolineales bacterium]